MNNLQEFNKQTFEKYQKFPNKQELASPLLVSSNEEYLNGLKKRVLYIGQETNCWVNYKSEDIKPNVQELEDEYLKFLKERCAVDRDFWKFIRECLDISRQDLVKNIIWSNTFICSKRTQIGAPNQTKELVDLSLEYLTYLYNYFEPDYTILVNGPRNPYYKLTIEFLKNIKSDIVSYYPTKETPVIADDSKNILWTYHPNYQNRSGLKKQIITDIQKRIK